jgi:uncharacterized protein (TIGR02413 family)
MPQGESCPAAFLCSILPQEYFPVVFCCDDKGGEYLMTLNILFFTITIKKRKMSLEEMRHNERVEQLIEENKSRQAMLRQF